MSTMHIVNLMTRHYLVRAVSTHNEHDLEDAPRRHDLRMHVDNTNHEHDDRSLSFLKMQPRLTLHIESTIHAGTAYGPKN